MNLLEIGLMVLIIGYCAYILFGKKKRGCSGNCAGCSCCGCKEKK